MISVAEAAQIFGQVLPLWEGALFAEDLISDRQYPPFHRVMMDGVAVKYECYQKGQREFPIGGICPAGEAQKKLSNENSCMEVMTGCPLPTGADLVIPYEHLEIRNGIAKISLEAQRSFMDNVHLEGSDCKKGELVLKKGSVLNGPHAGIAASLGYEPLPSGQSPRIMVISTGNELVEVSETPLPHQIRRSNVHALASSLRINQFSNVVLDHLDDDPKIVSDHYEKHASNFDLMIYSGGVSQGKFDYLPNVWSDLGVTKYFHKVAQRPGKPLWFGEDKTRGTLVLGLPGNPISSLVCLHRYIIPGKKIYVKLSEQINFNKNLTYFLPVKIEYKEDASINAVPLKVNNSGEFTALAGSDGFIELPADKDQFFPGEIYPFYAWRHF